MKVLDVGSLTKDIDQTRKNIDTFQDQISKAQRAVRNVTLLENSFKGKTGDAIRSFYNKVHQTFLIQLYEFLIDFENVLDGMKNSVHAFEPSPNGRVEQNFLENDIDQGLKDSKRVTLDLTDASNNVIQNISDIVSLSRLDPGEFVARVQEGQRKNRNVIEQLHHLDQSQTDSLKSLKQQLETMKSYVTDMASMVQNKDFSISNFNKLMMYTSDAYVEMTGASSIVQHVVKNYLNKNGMLPQDTTAKDGNQEINKEDSSLDIIAKYGKVFAHLGPLLIMLNPRLMFPITYRKHKSSNNEVNLDNLKKKQNNTRNSWQKIR